MIIKNGKEDSTRTLSCTRTLTGAVGKNGKKKKYIFLEKWESSSSYTSLKKTHTRYYYDKVYRANKCVSVFTHSQDHENVLSSEDGIL